MDVRHVFWYRKYLSLKLFYIILFIYLYIFIIFIFKFMR